MTHVAFESAGQAPGLEIWTIEQFEPVAVDPKTYGKFYNGDCYIVLKSSGDSNYLAYDAHFWLGSKSTQDKRGAAAIWTITLDDMLAGKAVHHREPQGYESAAFLGYFKPAIRYVEGGNESGFTEVETNAGAEKRLLKLKGSENMRIEEVPAEASSLTKDHCFILEVDHDIFVLMPDGAKATQRRKIISVANSLRDDYHNGRATIEIIDEFSSDEDFAMFFDALGSGSRDELVSDDETSSYTREDMTAVYLYRVLDGEDLDVIAVSKPYKQDKLSTNEIYILDTPDAGVFIWLGGQVDQDLKKKYLDIATKYLDVKGYPSWVSISKVSEGNESATFKQYFHDWDVTATRAISRFTTEIQDESDASDYITAVHVGKSAAARSYMPDEGDGNLEITRFMDGSEDVTESLMQKPVLYQKAVYVVKYGWTNDDGEGVVVYLWVGKDASRNDINEATELVKNTEDEIQDNLTVFRIPSGKECKHFLKLFKGNLAIVYGSGEPENAKGDYETTKARLFRVEGTKLGVDMRATQVPETVDNVEDDAVYIAQGLDADNGDPGIFVRNGKESSADEQKAAQNFMKSLLEDISFDPKVEEVFDQGNENSDFWNILGGDLDSIKPKENSDWKLKANRRVNMETTMTAVTVKPSGKIMFEDLDTQYTQQDLSDDGVYILDTGEELFLWQGTNIPERVKTARENIIKSYIEDDGLDRTADNALIVFVKQGSEPKVFKKHFENWENDMWENQTSYEDMKSQTKSGNSS